MHLDETLQMMLSIYVTLGVFLLLASRNPSANRSLIAFTAWSSFVHAVLMAGGGFSLAIARGGSFWPAGAVFFCGCPAPPGPPASGGAPPPPPSRPNTYTRVV